MKTNLTIIFIFAVLFSCSKKEVVTKNKVCVDTNCKNYTSQSAAQADFDADKECRKDLDHDGDGIACEEPGNEVRDCTSTSKCGCSSYNKDDCGSNPCCAWTTGQGCGCK